VGYRRSTVWKVLWRHGCSQRRCTPKQRFTCRYEWAEPGALLHMDAKQLPRFDTPGHWAHGDRSVHARNSGPARIEFAHVVVDDHSRLAYVRSTAGTAATSPPPCWAALPPGWPSRAVARSRR
jgi:hypothetical protein